MTLSDRLVPTDPPPFDEPWQAQAYAMAQVLIESGDLTAESWAEAFGAAIRARLSAGEDDTVDTYFAAVLDGLQTVLPLGDTEITACMEDWRRAYLATPHGKPVAVKRIS